MSEILSFKSKVIGGTDNQFVNNYTLSICKYTDDSDDFFCRNTSSKYLRTSLTINSCKLSCSTSTCISGNLYVAAASGQVRRTYSKTYQYDCITAFEFRLDGTFVCLDISQNFYVKLSTNQAIFSNSCADTGGSNSTTKLFVDIINIRRSGPEAIFLDNFYISSSCSAKKCTGDGVLANVCRYSLVCLKIRADDNQCIDFCPSDKWYTEVNYKCLAKISSKIRTAHFTNQDKCITSCSTSSCHSSKMCASLNQSNISLTSNANCARGCPANDFIDAYTFISKKLITNGIEKASASNNKCLTLCNNNDCYYTNV